jgi:molecular chaperone DnaK
VPAGNRRMVWLLGGTAAVLVGAVAVVLVLTSGGGGQTPAGTPLSAPNREIAQYEYRFTVPDGWIQTGGDPAKLKTEIKPSNATQGQDKIQVEEIRLAFDSDADRARAVDKLRTDYNNQAGSEFTGFDDQARYVGRLVVHYQQHSGGTTVDWYILFKAHTQVSVGCQFTDDGHDTVTSACDTVVGTLTITE